MPVLSENKALVSVVSVPGIGGINEINSIETRGDLRKVGNERVQDGGQAVRSGIDLRDNLRDANVGLFV